MSTSIRYLGYDAQASPPRPQFEVDIGANAKYRIDVAASAALFAPGASRTPSTFHYEFVIQSGVSNYTLPAQAWIDLDQSGGGFHSQVTSWDAQNRNREVSSPIWFDFLPHIQSIQPDKGPVTGGTQLIINGFGFSYLTGVEVGGIAAQTSTSNDRSLMIQSPATAQPAVVIVAVRTSFGVSPAIPAAQFTYETVPSFTPTPPAAPEIVDVRIVPTQAVPTHDPEGFLGDAPEVRRGREYRVEVAYDQSFSSVPDRHLTINISGTPLQVSLTPSTTETNVSLSEPFILL